MIICNDCGHVFDESEWGDYGECPMCRSTNTGEAVECPICGEYHNGYIEGNIAWCCPECFQKALTAENFLKYATSGTEHMNTPDVLEDFIMLEVFKIEEQLKYSSYEFKKHCEKVYKKLENPTFGASELDVLIKDYFFRVPDMYDSFTYWLVDEHEKAAKA